MKKRGLSGVITIILLILIVLISISIVWLFVRPAIEKIVGTNDENPGEISKLVSCLDISFNVGSCDFLGNDTYEVTVRRGGDELQITGLFFNFKASNTEFTIFNNSFVPEQFGSARYKFNLSEETDARILSVDVAALLSTNNTCGFTGISVSCNQQGPQGGGNMIYEPGSLSTYALSWDGTLGLNENIIPMFQLRAWENSNTAFQYTSQPSEYKAIIDRSRYQGINTNISDRCMDPVTQVYYDCIWWDNGVESAKARYNTFLSEYQQLGGELDYWILDTETWLSNWAIGSNKNDPVQQARWRAIQNDPRNVTLFAELADRGFIGQNLTTVHDWQSGDNYLVWNALMKEKVAGYYNELYDVVRQYYPNVKVSNYGLYHWSQQYEVPEQNGHRQYKYGLGSHVGNHQSQDGLYGDLGQITNFERLFPGYTYEPTAFNAFRYEVNRMRSMQLSNIAGIQPWVIYKAWNKSLMLGSDYYEELMIHIALADPDVMLYWNPHSSGSPPANDTEDILLSNVLLETDYFTGFPGKQAIDSNYQEFTNESWWMSDYVLSGASVGNRKAWRFTPDTEIATTIVQLPDSVAIETGKYSIIIPLGVIEPNQVSTIGTWIIQPQGAGDPIIVEI